MSQDYLERVKGVPLEKQEQMIEETYNNEIEAEE